MSLTTHLDAESAYTDANAAVRQLWPKWSGDLLPLKPLLTPLRATVFRIADAPVPAVVKIWGPGNAAKAAAQAARQDSVARQMNSGAWRASGVLSFDAQRCAMVMQDAGTTSLLDLLHAHPEQAEAVAQLSGQWLAAYHSHSLRPHPFRPAGLKTWLLRLADDCQNGKRMPPNATQLIAAATHHADTAMALRGLPSAKAITHRDLTLGNLIQGSDAIWGIDFENTKEDEPFRDVFSLAVDLGPAGLPALLKGYGPKMAAPKVTAFLCRAFALGLWANSPTAPSKRQAARLDVAMSLVDVDWAAV